MKVLIAGNWKMHMTPAQSVILADAIKYSVEAKEDCCEVLVCPSFIALSSVNSILAGSRVKLGAQNIHPEPYGAYTGETSAEMLIAAGCSYVICGHSERRHIFKETDSFINQKVVSSLKSGLIPILCVGETLEERESDLTFNVVEKHLKSGLMNILHNDLSNIVIAYEPVWAIGTGKTATPEQAQEVHHFIRKLLREMDPGIGDQIRILYGGSVKPDNIENLLMQTDINGALVGGASLKVETFMSLVEKGI